MTKQPITSTAPSDRRAGTYDHDDEVIGLLQYGTDNIIDVPRDLRYVTAGQARDRNLILVGKFVSANHFVMERRARGLVVTDDASKNGLAYEVGRDFGPALKTLFQDRRDTGEGFLLVPGTSFVVGAEPYRFVALDDVMRAHHARLVEILGRENEAHGTSEGGETPSHGTTKDGETPTPSDLLLAARSPCHLLITGKPGCDQEELARAIHMISQRRRQPIIEVGEVPQDRASQSVLLKERSPGTTLVVNLGADRKRLDPAFVSSMLSPSYRLRVLVIACTANQARRSLGHHHWRSLRHIALLPLAQRRSDILPLLDQWLSVRGSVLRVADLTSHNQRALQFNPWRENLRALREAAVRLDAIALAGFSRKRAAAQLGILRQTFDHWFNNTMRLTKPLVPDSRKRELTASLSGRSSG